MNYAQSNYLIDTVMPQVKPTTFKVIMLIARQTWGWRGRGCVELSYAELKTMTGIKSHNTLKEAIAEAEPYINQTPGKTQGFIYSMKPMTMSNFDTPSKRAMSKNDISKFDTVSENDFQNLTPSLSEIDTPELETMSNIDIDTRLLKEEERKKEKEDNDLPPTEITIDSLTDYFTRLFPNCHPNPGSHIKNWAPVFEDWIGEYGLETAERLRQAADVASGKNSQGKRYKIMSPRSLVNIISNLEPEMNGHHPDLWESQVMAWVRNEREFDGLDTAVKDAIRKSGGDGIKSMNNFQLKDAKESFYKVIAQ